MRSHISFVAAAAQRAAFKLLLLGSPRRWAALGRARSRWRKDGLLAVRRAARSVLATREAVCEPTKTRGEIGIEMPPGGFYRFGLGLFASRFAHRYHSTVP